MDRQTLKKKTQQAQGKVVSLLDDLAFMYGVYMETGNELEANCVAGLIAHFRAGGELLEDLRKMVV